MKNSIVVSLSRKILTEAQISLLSKGLKFCPTPEKVDVCLCDVCVRVLENLR